MLGVLNVSGYKMTRIIGARKIPRKIAFIGDRSECQKWVGRADAILQELEERVLRAPLGINMDSILVDPAPGVVIECKVRFDLRKKAASHTVDIYTGGAYDRKEELYECFCTCHLSHGYVINPRYGCYDISSDITYDVVVCAKKELYVLIQNAVPLFRRVFADRESVLLLYEPVVETEVYSVGMDGCGITRARITTLKDNEFRFERIWHTK